MSPKETLEMKTHEQLAGEIEEIAQSAKANHRLGESYIIQSNARVIMSNARNEKAIYDLTNEIAEFNKEAGNQTQKLIKLTWVIVALTVLMLAGLFVQILKV